MPAMNPIATAELTSLRAEIAAAACDTSCTIKRQTTTADGLGSGSGTYTTVSTVNVGLKPPNATQLQAYDYMIGASKAWMVKFPYGTDVREQDHLVIGSDTLVVQSDVSLSSYSALTMMLAVEVK